MPLGILSPSFTLIAADLFICLWCEYNINNLILFLAYTAQQKNALYNKVQIVNISPARVTLLD